MIAVVDALRGAILLTRDGVPVGGGEMTVVGGAILVLFRRDASLIGFGVGGTFGSDLAVANTVVDAGLLTALAGADRVALSVSGGLSRGSGNGESKKSRGEK